MVGAATTATTIPVTPAHGHVPKHVRPASGPKPRTHFLRGWPQRRATPDTLEWQPATELTGDLAEELTKPKQQPGKNIQIPGRSTLVRWLLRDGLLDELSLNV